MGKQAAAPAPAEPGDEKLNIIEDGSDAGDGPLHDEEDDRVPADADRGDDLHPEDKDTAGLKAVAAEADEGEEGEEGTDEAGADQQPPAGGGKKGSAVVSHGRFNEVNEALKAEREARLRLEEELARARGAAGTAAKKDGDGQQQAGTEGEQQQTVDLKALRKQRLNAMMEGDEDKALELEEQIEAEIRRQAEEAAVKRITEDNAKRLQQQAEAEFKEAAAEIMATYPALDAGTREKPNPNANPIAIAAVVQIRNQQIHAGRAPADALRNAVEQVAKAMALQRADADGDDQGQQQGVVDPKQVRKQQIVRRNAEAARRQPADIATTGAGRGARGAAGTESEINVRDLTEEEFDALPAAERKRLRGD
jgi:hypothetical protein